MSHTTQFGKGDYNRTVNNNYSFIIILLFQATSILKVYIYSRQTECFVKHIFQHTIPSSSSAAQYYSKIAGVIHFEHFKSIVWKLSYTKQAAWRKETIKFTEWTGRNGYSEKKILLWLSTHTDTFWDLPWKKTVINIVLLYMYSWNFYWYLWGIIWKGFHRLLP